jgi:hypothetical protein
MTLSIDPRMAQGIGGQANPLGASQQTPGASDVERFKEAMQHNMDAQPPQDAQAGASQVGHADAHVDPASAASPSALGMGDRILQGMRGISEKVQAGREAGMSVMGQENVSQADLLRAQFSLNESSTLLTVTSKTVEKVSQGIKQLQQG